MGSGGGGIVGTVVQGALAPVTSGASLLLPKGLGGLSSGNPLDDLWGDLTGRGAADAAGLASMAQLRQARESRDAIMGESARGERDIMSLAQATPAELQAQEQALAMGGKQLAADERLLASIDPALMEASQKALSMLREGYQSPQSGRVPAAYAPFEAQRQAERQKLVNSLQSQYGPGAETSSIGSKALREFDLAGATQSAQFGMQQDQQNYGRFQDAFQGASNLANLLGGQRQGIDLQARGFNQIGTAGIFQNRMLNSRTGLHGSSLAALSGAQAPLIQSAGAPYVAQQARAQGQTAFMQNLVNAGIGGGLAAIGGKGGGTKMSEGGRVPEPSIWANLVSNLTTGQAATNQTWDSGGVRAQHQQQRKTKKYSQGGVVRGSAPVPGNSPQNDVVPAQLSPGEIVIPRSHAGSKKKAESFLAKLFKAEKAEKG